MAIGSKFIGFMPAAALLLVSGSALADTIDGNWCHADGRRFSIRGPEIVTPAGRTMEGNYSRHWFSYMAPAPEPGAGETIFMTLVNENTVHLRVGQATPGSGEQVWVRCAPSISRLRAARTSA